MRNRAAHLSLASIIWAGLTPTLLAGGPTLAALYRSVLQPPLDRVAVVENVVFDLGGFHFVLTRGQLALSAPIAGHAVAAVFLGNGGFTVEPANDVERASIQFFRNDDRIHVGITAAVFRFPNESAFLRALNGQVHFKPLAAEGDFGDLLKQRADRMDEFGRPQAARVLDALLDGGSSDPLFYAEMHTTDRNAVQKVYAWLQGYEEDWLYADYDPTEATPSRVHVKTVRAIQPLMAGLRPGQYAVWGAPNSPTRPNPYLFQAFDDAWTQFGSGRQIAPQWKLDDYKLSVQASGKGPLVVSADMAATALGVARGGLFLRLDSNFQVAEAASGTSPLEWVQPPDPGRPGTFVQDNLLDGRDNTVIEGNWLYVRLPAPLAVGETVRLRLRYLNKRAGIAGHLRVASEVAWYPRPATGPAFQPAHFDVHFAISGGREPQAIGAPNGGSEPVAAVNFALPIGRGNTTGIRLEDGRLVTLTMPPSPSPFAPYLNQIAQALRFYSHEFGDYPFPRLIVTPLWLPAPADPYTGGPLLQGSGAGFDALSNLWSRHIPGAIAFVPVRDDPSWPMWMVLNSTLTPMAERAAMRQQVYTPETAQQVDEFLVPHEVAHQWFGNSVGFASEGDEWLAEGFANAAAFLFDEASLGTTRATANLQRWQHELLKPDQYGKVAEQDGPLAWGRRLASSRDRLGFEIVTYDKGGYVLEMLRALMEDHSQHDPDAAFIAMMHAWVAAYSGRAATTADFKALAEKYMTPAMDVDDNRRLDWFFDEYVNHTGIPQLEFHSVTAPTGNGSAVTLTVGNPSQWRGVLPIYIFRDATHSQRVLLRVAPGQDPVVIPLPFVPTAVQANPKLEMLVTVTAG